MSIDTAAEVAEKFLRNYVKENNFFTPEEELDAYDASTARIGFFRAQPHPTLPDTIMFTFLYGRELSKGDEELEDGVRQSMEALTQAHPEVSQYKTFIDFMKSR